MLFKNKKNIDKNVIIYLTLKSSVRRNHQIKVGNH